MPITYGSVGDIISTALLIKDLVQALNNSRGAAAEYKELKRELTSLEDVLLKIDALCSASSSHGGTPELLALKTTGMQIAEQCRHSIQTFKLRLMKYESTLHLEKGRSLRLACAKVRWQVGEKEDVLRFRAEILAHSASLNMLLGTTNWSINQANRDALQTFSETTQRQLSTQDSSLMKLTTESRASFTSVLDGIAWLQQLGRQFVSSITNLFFLNLATYSAVVAIEASLPGKLERSLIGEPFILEDAIGRVSPVHLQFINSWAALEAVLETRFRGIQGHDMVVRGDYALQDHATNHDISRSRTWEGAFLPGQRVEMSLVFKREDSRYDSLFSSARTTCPRCHSAASDRNDADIICSKCGLCYRRVTEIEEIDPLAPAPGTSATRPPMFGHSSSVPSLGSAPSPAIDLERYPTSDAFSRAEFKRIRLVSKICRTPEASTLVPATKIRVSPHGDGRLSDAHHQADQDMVVDQLFNSVRRRIKEPRGNLGKGRTRSVGDFTEPEESRSKQTRGRRGAVDFSAIGIDPVRLYRTTNDDQAVCETQADWQRLRAWNDFWDLGEAGESPCVSVH